LYLIGLHEVSLPQRILVLLDGLPEPPAHAAQAQHVLHVEELEHPAAQIGREGLEEGQLEPEVLERLLVERRPLLRLDPVGHDSSLTFDSVLVISRPTRMTIVIGEGGRDGRQPGPGSEAHLASAGRRTVDEGACGTSPFAVEVDPGEVG
jgi:hypothetical protein